MCWPAVHPRKAMTTDSVCIRVHRKMQQRTQRKTQDIADKHHTTAPTYNDCSHTDTGCWQHTGCWQRNHTCWAQSQLLAFPNALHAGTYCLFGQQGERGTWPTWHAWHAFNVNSTAGARASLPRVQTPGAPLPKPRHLTIPLLIKCAMHGSMRPCVL
jgi:hypothetical protein